MNDYSHATYSNDHNNNYDHLEDVHDNDLGLIGKNPTFSSDEHLVDHVSPTTSGLGNSECDYFNSPSGSGKISIKKSEKKIKKPKCAFQTRSQVDILDDGYRWRKYGQKAVKNNKFPRFDFSSKHIFFFSLLPNYIVKN